MDESTRGQKKCTSNSDKTPTEPGWRRERATKRKRKRRHRHKHRRRHRNTTRKSSFRRHKKRSTNGATPKTANEAPRKTPHTKTHKEKGGEEGGRRKTPRSPTRGGALVSRQTGRAVDRSGGTPQDCTRVFPVKGAADALCNPEAGVLGHVSGQAAGRAGLGSDPSHDALKALGTTHSREPPRQVGKRWPRAQQLEKPCPGRLVSGFQPRGRHQPRTGRRRRGERTGATKKPTNPRLQRSQRHSWGPRSAGRRLAAGGVGGRMEGSISGWVPPGSGSLGGGGGQASQLGARPT